MNVIDDFQLPAPFLDRMKALLGDEFPAFVQSLALERMQGLRANLLKLSPDTLRKTAPFELEPVPWAREGFYFTGKAVENAAEPDVCREWVGEDGKIRPGKHPWHEAGVYYIQEPSAMSAAALLAPEPGERVLDLCAAPGGKATQLAARMGGKGLLIANEIHPARAKILSQNVERLGIANCMVLNEAPERLAGRFAGFFDKILVDAPCSGEGMFRKEPAARQEWSVDNVLLCAKRQQEILGFAAGMLRPGGKLLYSTCTFAPEENEGTVSRFLRENPDFSVVEMPAPEGFSHGVPGWTELPAPGIEHTFRLWPHRLAGEGHFLALLEKAGNRDSHHVPEKGTGKMPEEFRVFAKENLVHGFWTELPSRRFVLFGEQLYLLPECGVQLDRLKVLRPGLHLGTLKKNRFEPAHAFALSLNAEEARQRVELHWNQPECAAWLRGETLSCEGAGWHLVCVDGFPLGWGKASGGVLKNHYPKGLRKG